VVKKLRILSNLDEARVADLTTRSYLNSASAGGNAIGQTKPHLRKIEIRLNPHVLCGNVVTLIISANQIYSDGVCGLVGG
jgi:hypothetical protein